MKVAHRFPFVALALLPLCAVCQADRLEPATRGDVATTVRALLAPRAAQVCRGRRQAAEAVIIL